MRLDVRLSLTFACAISLAVVPAAARAAEQLEDGPAPAAPRRAPAEPYSGQIVAADFAGMAAAVMLANTTNQDAVVLIAPLAAPAVHLLHGNPGRAAASLLLNVALPVMGAVAGYSLDASSCGPETWFCGLGGLVMGGLVGIVSAIGIDAAVLARLPDEAEAPSGRAAAARKVTPLFAMSRDGGVSFGLGGRF